MFNYKKKINYINYIKVPQLDILITTSTLISVSFFYIFFLIFNNNHFLPKLSAILKLRYKILHKGLKSKRHAPANIDNLIEDAKKIFTDKN
jgi:hypothetical protein